MSPEGQEMSFLVPEGVESRSNLCVARHFEWCLHMWQSCYALPKWAGPGVWNIWLSPLQLFVVAGLILDQLLVQPSGKHTDERGGLTGLGRTPSL